uniref:Uncharacterized protein n=1 Tax=Dictyoglomus turgidum TaxID=513050 RepID=A0A7C3WRB1_9BACT
MKKEIEIPDYLLLIPKTQDDFDEYIMDFKDFINDVRKSDIKSLLKMIKNKKRKNKAYEYSQALDEIIRYLKNQLKKLS